MKALCEALGEPQKSFESIHIAGTNGKGSTAFYLARILRAHGVSAGLFTSPHLVSVRERFEIDGEMISQAELDSILSRIEAAAKAAKAEPSYFEVLTAAAFLWFKERKAQAAVLEAGLGGRLDSTKIARGSVAAITSIGLDHTELLGCSKEEILREKLGILKKGAALVLGDLQLGLLAKCPPHIKARRLSPELQVGNCGKVYARNAELAYAAAKQFLEARMNIEFSDKLARKALKGAAWPGRMQMLRKNGRLRFILDGAHNPDAAKMLAKHLKESNLPPMPCLFASMSDKDTEGVLKALRPHISVCIPARTENSRARSAEEICGICDRLKIKTAPFSENFLGKCKSPVLITGSLYLVGKAAHELSPMFSALARFRGLEMFPNEASLAVAR